MVTPNRCKDCGDYFQQQRTLKQHEKTKVCFKKLFTEVTRDCIEINNEIVSELQSTRLKFYAAKKLGVYQQKLYPLTFSKLSDSMRELEDLLPNCNESISIRRASL